MKRLVISTDDLTKNVKTIKSLTQSKIIGVLKGNGYGLGLIEFAEFLKGKGIDFFAVSEPEEALKLRNTGFTEDLLLLTPVYDIETAKELVKLNIIFTVSSERSAKIIDSVAAEMEMKVCAHLKLDTGFGRYGFTPEKVNTIVDALKPCENIIFTGTYTHFAHSFAASREAAESQQKVFETMVAYLSSQGFNTGMLHTCNSCGFLNYPEYHLDAVRIGSAFLGRVPVKNKKKLIRIAHFETEVTEVKLIPKGWEVGYGNTFHVKKDTWIGVVPAGYIDGIFVEKVKDAFRPLDILRYTLSDMKMFGGRHYVTSDGRKLPIMGRINMFSFVVDISESTMDSGTTINIDVNPLMVNSDIKRVWL